MIQGNSINKQCPEAFTENTTQMIEIRALGKVGNYRGEGYINTLPHIFHSGNTGVKTEGVRLVSGGY